jgi:RimJ/RimL family protein N-acetyltransferase
MSSRERAVLGLGRTRVALLASVGAQRIKIVYDPDNPASGHLYRSVGFEPHRYTDVLAGPTTS